MAFEHHRGEGPPAGEFIHLYCWVHAWELVASGLKNDLVNRNMTATIVDEFWRLPSVCHKLHGTEAELLIILDQLRTSSCFSKFNSKKEYKVILIAPRPA